MTRTLIFAHRGANREAGENTRCAFDKALGYAIDGIETDVQLSRDEVAVLWHDRFLAKLGLPGKHIDDFDYAELQEMDFAAHFPCAAPEGIVTLQAFLEAYRARCRLLVEIKNRDWEPPARHQLKMRKTLVQIGAAQGDDILVSSFNLASLVYAHQRAPGFPLVYNFEDDQDAEAACRVLDDYPFLRGLCVHVSTLDAGMVAAVRGRGKLLAVYTCNSEAEIGKALELGVDILISDVPHKALQMRAT